MTFNPSLREAIDRVLADFRNSMHTCFPAQVLAYDAAEQTVDLRPAIQREVAADEPDVAWGFESLPDLLSVPVQWSRTGTWGATFPITVGDWMMVLCAEQSLLLWRSRGTTHTKPGINDPHGLNGCIAVPGWFPDGAQLKNVSATDMVVGRLDGSASIRIKPDGTVVLSEDAMTLALAPLVEKAIETAIKGHTHTVTTAGTAEAQTGTTAAGVLGGAVLSTAASKVRGA